MTTADDRNLNGAGVPVSSGQYVRLLTRGRKRKADRNPNRNRNRSGPVEPLPAITHTPQIIAGLFALEGEITITLWPIQVEPFARTPLALHFFLGFWDQNQPRALHTLFMANTCVRSWIFPFAPFNQ